MNPQGYPAEAVQLQGRYEGFPGQPGYTAVNLISEPPKDHIIWSLCCFVYCNPFCLGLAALINSIKARDRKVARDLEGARHYASKARCLNIWATVLTSIGFLIFIIFVIVVAKQAFNAYNSVTSYDSRYNYNGYNYRG